ncbi:phosphoribosylglycinamide formyltransferase [Candidatus Pseudothioglobus singularis]|nr:phosphoribosylglycinamide formyltransferase [Candidatus Pseudothioglobus singularis]
MRAVILISGNGSNLQSLIDNAKKIDLEICSVISNKEDAFGLKRAKRANITAHFVDPNLYKSREDFDKKLITIIDELDISLIVLAGYMRILSSDFIHHFSGKILNIHPSLLPKFPGLNTHRKAIDAKEKYHGATVHFATEELDGGPIISHEIVEIDPIDTEHSLAQKVLEKEHILYPRVIHWYTQNRLKLINNEFVEIDGKTL